MRMTSEQKAELVSKFQTGTNDTGSPEVQVALLTHRINSLTSHFKTNVKDFSGRRGLLKMVSSRRSLLDFLNRESNERYTKLIASLNIRK